MSLNCKGLEITNWKMEPSLQQPQKIVFGTQDHKTLGSVLSILKNIDTYHKKEQGSQVMLSAPEKGHHCVLEHAQFQEIHGMNVLRWPKEVIYIPRYRKSQRRRSRRQLTIFSRTVDSYYPSFFYGTIHIRDSRNSKLYIRVHSKC